MPEIRRPRYRSANFDRGTRLLLAVSATGGARKRDHRLRSLSRYRSAAIRGITESNAIEKAKTKSTAFAVLFVLALLYEKELGKNRGFS